MFSVFQIYFHRTQFCFSLKNVFTLKFISKLLFFYQAKIFISFIKYTIDTYLFRKDLNNIYLNDNWISANHWQGLIVISFVMKNDVDMMYKDKQSLNLFIYFFLSYNSYHLFGSTCRLNFYSTSPQRSLAEIWIPAVINPLIPNNTFRASYLYTVICE